ncbi:hypothetical protein ACRQ5Q_17885 [Bradyrhizobium sp. PMVTL-01]|uniref:hypothetical protein n=1 Tax=Bradyrhizobium sp. PMVTL-01 TaxID=3434999 RepID=UPI003F718666
MGRTLKQLIECYRTDPDSNFLNLRYQVRVKHDRLFGRLSQEFGNQPLKSIRFRTLSSWYRAWLADGKIAKARSLVDRLRELFRFGATLLEDGDCSRLFEALRKLRLETVTPRAVTMTVDHANAIRLAAREHFGWYSIALAQALQFELLLGQKDVIGEWVPVDEHGESDVVLGSMKWLRGLRWSNIDKNMILHYAVGSSRRPIKVDLRTAPMVLEELKLTSPDWRDAIGCPSPLVICDTTGLPWSPAEFRRKWRKVAAFAGLPDTMKNRNSFPAGTIVGDQNRASVSQTVTLPRINYSLRMQRKKVS